MKNQLTRIVIIVAATALSIIFLLPTYKDYQFRKVLNTLHGQDSLSYFDQHHDDIADAKLKRLKLGLDLQGGMRVVLEVDVLSLLDKMAKNKDDNFETIIKEMRTENTDNDISLIPIFVKKFQTRGIRLSRYFLNVRDDDDKVQKYLEDEASKAVDRASEVVGNRVDQYHVSEPNIQKQGSRRVIVELPGVKDENEVRQLLQGTALLEFRLVKDPQITYKVMETIDKFLTGSLPSDSSEQTSATSADGKKQEPKKVTNALTELTGEAASVAAKDTSSDAKFSKEHPFFYYVRTDKRATGDGFVLAKDKDRVSRLLERADVQKLLPPDFEFLWSAKAQKYSDGTQYNVLYAVKSTPELTGNVVVGAQASVDPEDNRPVVNMEMNSEGAREWARITGANIGKRIAIALDKGVFSAPVVQGKIPGGHSRISGMESANEARLLEIVLKAGALPAPVSIIEERAVGASLGEDSIRSGFFSFALAFLLTVAFMVVYYHTSGAIADLALLFNVLFILGVLAGFQATLTLPGIAGIVLTIGMAVDANVLINERIREEMEGGKTLRAAIDAGYSKAFAAIFDSNITTFLTGLVLYQFGTGPVQGFALTLMIGLAASMFSAIVITHVIFNIMTDKGLNPNFG